MGATQGCSYVERVQPHSPIESARPVEKAAGPTPTSLWAKCKDAVHEFRRFQKFLMKHFSSPSQAFDILFEGCQGRVVRGEFKRLTEKAGFRGDTGLVFAMLKDGADEYITRDSFRQRLKTRASKTGDDFLAVVGQAIAAAALQEKSLGAAGEGF